MPAALGKAIKASKLPPSSISIHVTPVGSKRAIASLNPGVARNPASVIKLITTWGALDRLGPTHRWTTRVYALGPVKDGVLRGDLLIEGGGDPYLVLEDFWKLVGEIHDAGIKDITGNLVLDQSRYAPATAQPGDFDSQPHRLYNVAPAALLPNFKSIRFVFESMGEKVLVRTQPPLANLKLTSQISLTIGKCRGNGPQVAMAYPESATRDAVVFTGKLPASCRRYRLHRTAMTANSYTYGLFRHLWEASGGTLKGAVHEGVAPKDRSPLIDWKSRPLGEVIRPLNKWSNNTMARSLLLSLGATRHRSGVTPAHGEAALMDHLRKRGLDITDLKVDNGSGLSRKGRATASFLTALLRTAWRAPTMPEYMASLSLVGRDGTARRRFIDHPAGGRMHVKTGQLDGAIAVAGYVLAKSGKRYTVAVIVNHRRAHVGPGQKIRDAVLKWVYLQ